MIVRKNDFFITYYVEKRSPGAECSLTYDLSSTKGFVHEGALKSPPGRDRVNPIQGRGAHCAPPPQVNFLKYLKNALSYRVETF